MNDDRDPLDALLHSGARAYPPAAPDNSRLRHVVATARRRDRRARGSVLACATVMVAGGSLLAIRPSSEPTIDSAEAPPGPTTASPPEGPAIDALPPDFVASYCGLSPEIPPQGLPVSAVWFVGTEAPAAEFSATIDGQPFFDSHIPPVEVPPGPLGVEVLPEESPPVTAAESTADSVPPTMLPSEVTVVAGIAAGLESNAGSGVAAFFFGPIEGEGPHVLSFTGDFGPEPIDVTLTDGVVTVVDMQGTVTTYPVEDLETVCDQTGSEEIDTDQDPVDSTVVGGGDAETDATDVEPSDEPRPDPTDEATPTTTPADTVPVTTVGDPTQPTTSVVTEALPDGPACGVSEDGSGSATLWLSNQSFTDESIDVEVRVDGALVASETLETGDQHQFTSIEMPVENGMHEVSITSAELDEPVTAQFESGNGVYFAYSTDDDVEGTLESIDLIEVYADCNEVGFG